MQQNCPAERSPSATNWLRRVLGILLFTALGYPSAAQETGAIDPAGPDQMAFSLQNMKPSISPSQDFYQYAAGGWLERVKRPERYGSYGFFEIVADRVEEQMRQVLPAGRQERQDRAQGQSGSAGRDILQCLHECGCAKRRRAWRRSSLSRCVEAIKDMNSLDAFHGAKWPRTAVRRFPHVGPDVDFTDNKVYPMFSRWRLGPSRQIGGCLRRGRWRTAHPGLPHIPDRDIEDRRHAGCRSLAHRRSVDRNRT